MKRSDVEIETKRRINICVWAFAYQFLNQPLVPDSVFDVECMMVDLNINTSRPDMDSWFRKNFQPYTGIWIYSHPELDKIADLYRKYYINH